MQKSAVETEQPSPPEIEPGRLPDRRSGGIWPQRAAPHGGGAEGPQRVSRARPGRNRTLHDRQRVDGGGQALLRNRPALDGRPCKAHRGAGGAVQPIHAAYDAHRRARHGQAGVPGCRAGAGRQPLQRSGVEPQPLLRFLEADLSHHDALAGGHARQDRGSRRAHAPAGELLPEAGRERLLSLQLPADQPRGPARDGPVERAEPGAGHGQPRARHGAFGRPPQHQPDRCRCVRGGTQRRHGAGQGHLPERHHPAHPVHPVHRQGVRAAAADRAAVDQQVLHPRSGPGEVLHQVRGVEGLYRVRGELGQSGREPRAQDLRGLHEGGHPGGDAMSPGARPGRTRPT